jgi:hypothetical protein
MKRLTGILALLIGLLFMANVANATNYYVSATDGNDADNGTTWALAKATIQGAIDIATDYDVIYVEGYNGSQKTYTPTLAINIPTNRNGLQIIGWNRTTNLASDDTDRPILDGTTLTTNNATVAANGFRINSDEVIIRNFIITNFNETVAGTTDLVNGPGAGILTNTATSGHEFYNNKIYNCNWGIYLQASYDVTIGASGDENVFYDINNNTGGGVAIYAYTAGTTISGTRINYNTFTSTGGAIERQAILFGGSSANAEFSEIKNNIFEAMSQLYATVEIKGVTNSLSVTGNAFRTCYQPIYIYGGATDNADVYVATNGFYATVSTMEVHTDNDFSAYTLFEIMNENSNLFSGYLTDAQGRLAATEYTNNAIISPNGTDRYIRNTIASATADAIAYNTLGNDVRLYVPGTAAYPNTVTSTGVSTFTQVSPRKLKVYGETLAYSVLKSEAANAAIFTTTGTGTSEFNNVTLTADLTTVGHGTALLDLANGVISVDGVTFNSTGGNTYTAINSPDGVDGLTCQNSTFSGRFVYGILIDPIAGTNLIKCNTFNSDVSNFSIYVYDQDSGGEVQAIDILGNTFNNTGGVSYGVIAQPVALSDINIGSSAYGNIFNYNVDGNGINVVQNPTTVEIAYNKFVSSGLTTGKAIQNDIAATLIAHYNYFDGVSTTTGITSLLSGAGSTNVHWAPVLTNGTDQDLATCGWQPLTTALWAPVYTSNTASKVFTSTTGVTYYESIQAGVNSGDTYVNLYDALFHENVTVAHDVYIRKATDFVGTVTVDNTGVTTTSPVFNVTSNTVVAKTIKDLTITSTGTGYPIALTGGASGAKNVSLLNNILTGASAASLVYVTENTATGDFTFTGNTFNLTGSTIGINFPSTVQTTDLGTVSINTNTFTHTGAYTGSAISFGTLPSSVDMQTNSFTGGYIDFYTEGSDNNGTAGDIQGNTIKATTAGVGGIRFLRSGVAGATGAITSYDIKHNLFDNETNHGLTAISFPATLVETYISGIIANYNNFANFTATNGYAVSFLMTTSASLGFDFKNNYYGSSAGPRAISAAPTWHDNYTANTYIVANSYNYSSQLARVNDEEASYDFYNNIVFTPWYSTISGSVGAYSGTSFFPIYNDETTVEYYPNLNFAVNGTNDAGARTIYMKDGSYTEDGVIEVDANAGTVTGLTITRSASTDDVNIIPNANCNAIFANGVNAAGNPFNMNLSYLDIDNNSKNIIDLVSFNETGAGNLSGTISYCDFTKTAGTISSFIAGWNMDGNLTLNYNTFAGAPTTALNYLSGNTGTVTVTNNTYSGAFTGNGVYFENNSTVAAITGNTFQHDAASGNAIGLVDNTSVISIQDNTFKQTAYGTNVCIAIAGDFNAQTVNIGTVTANTFGTTTGYLIQGGIFVTGTADHTVNAQNNTFNMEPTAAQTNGTAFWTVNGATGDFTVTFSNNNVYNAKVNGLWFANTPTVGNDITISDNTINCLGTANGIYFNSNQGNSVGQDITITDNTITGTGNLLSGIYFAANNLTLDGFTITGNDITNFGHAINVNADQGSAAAWTITGNNFSNNTYGFNNNSTSAFTASSNWWGSNNGPATAGAGLTAAFKNVFNVLIGQGSIVGLPTTGTVTYWPWLRTNKTGVAFAPIVKKNLTSSAITLHPNFTTAYASLVAAAGYNVYAATGTVTNTVSDTYTESLTFGGSTAATTTMGARVNDFSNWLTNPSGSSTATFTASTLGNASYAPVWTSPAATTNMMTLGGNYLTISGFIFNDNNLTGNLFYNSATRSDIKLEYNTFNVTTGSNYIYSGAASAELNSGSFGYNVVSYPAGANTWFNLYGTSSYSISNNTITNAKAVFTLNNAANIAGLQIQQNTFTTSADAILFTEDGSTPTGVYSSIVVNENIFNGTTAGNDAIVFGAGLVDDDADVPGWTNFAITSNSFLVGASNYGINFPVATPTLAVNATCNWWGHANGPSVASNPMTGLGAMTTTGVTYLKWRTTSNLTSSTNCDGFWVYTVNATRLPSDDGSAEWFVNIQDAITDATNNYIYVKNSFAPVTPESIALLAGASHFIGTATAGGTVNVTNITNGGDAADLTLEDNLRAYGSYTMAAANDNCDILMSGKNFTIDGNLTIDGGTNNITTGGGTLAVTGNLAFNNAIGSTNRIVVGTGAFNLAGDVTGWSTGNESYVDASSTGYFTRSALTTTIPNQFPVGTTGFNTGFILTETQNKWLGANKGTVRTRINQVDPTSSLGKNVGDDEYVLHNLYTIEQTSANVTGQLVTVNFYWDDLNTVPTRGAYFSANALRSFGAIWNGTDWTSYRTNSSWNAGNYTTVSNITYADMTTNKEWAIFTHVNGTDANLSNRATSQAKSIIFTAKTTTTLSLWWLKGNGTYSTVIVKPSSSSSHAITDATFINDVPTDGYQPVSGSGSSVAYGSGVVAHPTSGTTAKVVYDGTGNTCTITGLTSGQYYTIVILTGNGTGQKRNYMHRGLYETSNALEDVTSVEYNPGSATATNNERTTMTKPQVLLSLATANIGLGSIVSPNVVSYCFPNSQVYPVSLPNLLQFDMTGSIGSPVVGWTVKYTRTGSGTITLTPYPTASPAYAAASVTSASQNDILYSMVSAIDGNGTLCQVSGSVEILTYVQPSYTIADGAATCEGNSSVLTVASLAGSPTPTLVKWQRYIGGVWTDIADDAKYDMTGSAPYTLTVNNADAYTDNGAAFRAIFTNGASCGIYSDFPLETDLTGEHAILNVDYKVDITAAVDPSNTEACDGTAATFTSTIPDVLGASATLADYYSVQVDDDNAFGTPVFTQQGLISALPVTTAAFGGTTYTISTNGTQVIVTVNTVTAVQNNYNVRVGYKHAASCASYEYKGGYGTLTVTPNPTITDAATATWSLPTVCEGTTTPSAITITGTNIAKAFWEYSPAGATTWTALNAAGTAVGTATTVALFGKYTVSVGATSTTLTLTEMVNQDNTGTDWRFRVNFTNGTVPCVTGMTNITNELTVDPSFTYTTQPTDAYLCDNGSTTFTVVTSIATTKQWYYNTGSGWNPVTDMVGIPGLVPTISGSATATLSLTSIPNSWNNVQFQVRSTGGTCSNVASNTVTMKVYQLLVGSSPSNQTICQGNSTTFTATAGSNVSFGSGANTYQVIWKYNGTSFIDGAGVGIFTGATISGATTNTLSLTNIPFAANGASITAEYSITNGNLVTGLCAVTTTPSTLTVNPTPSAPTALALTEVNMASVSFSWGAPGTGSPASYEYRVNGGAEVNVGLATTATVTGLTRNTFYTIEVRGQFGACGAGPWTTPVLEVTTLDPTLVVNAIDPIPLTFPNTTVGSTSTLTYQLVATEIESATGVTITPPAEYKVWNGAIWAASYTPTLAGSETAGFTQTMTITIQFAPTSCGTKAGNVTDVAANTANPTVAVTGLAINAAPGTQALNIDFTSDNGTTINGTLTAGNGNGRIVLMNTTNTFTAPTNNTVYTVGQTIGTATVVAVGNVTTFSATVTAGTDRWFRVYEYNECASVDPIYATGTGTYNPNQVKKFGITLPVGQIMSGTSYNYTIVAQDRSGDNLASNDGVEFGLLVSGTSVISTPAVGERTIVNGDPGTSTSPTAITITNANGDPACVITVAKLSGSLGWIASPSSSFLLWPAEPVNQDYLIFFSNVSCASATKVNMRVNWRKGSNTPLANSLVLMRAGSAPDISSIADGYTTTSNRDWDLAPTVGTGTKAVWYGNFAGTTNYVDVTNLNESTTYHVRIFAAYGGTPATSQTDNTGETNSVTNYNITSIGSWNPSSRTLGACKLGLSEFALEVNNFNARSANKNVYTSWNTTSEYHNAGFEVYRLDTDMEIPVFVAVGSFLNNPALAGLNSSDATKNYKFVDETAEVGKTYLYKLVAFSVDGEQSEQGTALVTVTGDEAVVGNLSIYEIAPNPVSTNAKLSFYMPATQEATVEIIDLTGNVVSVPFKNVTFNSGYNAINLNCETITSGTYTLVIKSGSFVEAKRFVVVK